MALSLRVVQHRRVRTGGQTLVCLPFAGGSASAFHPWRGRLPAWTEVLAVDLPGRGARLLERPILCADDLLGEVVSTLERALARCPFHLYGHSFGGTLAVEVVRRSPHLTGARSILVSGGMPPHLLHERLPRRDGGRGADRAPADLPAHLGMEGARRPPFWQRGLRADLEVLRQLAGPSVPAVRVPLAVLAGTSDGVVPFRHTREWRHYAGGGFALYALAGGHFFPFQQTGPFFAILTRWLEGEWTRLSNPAPSILSSTISSPAIARGSRDLAGPLPAGAGLSSIVRET
jgi:surfactin synthase thioesterase subunit